MPSRFHVPPLYHSEELFRALLAWRGMKRKGTEERTTQRSTSGHGPLLHGHHGGNVRHGLAATSWHRGPCRERSDRNGPQCQDLNGARHQVDHARHQGVPIAPANTYHHHQFRETGVRPGATHRPLCQRATWGGPVPRPDAAMDAQWGVRATSASTGTDKHRGGPTHRLTHSHPERFRVHLR